MKTLISIILLFGCFSCSSFKKVTKEQTIKHEVQSFDKEVISEIVRVDTIIIPGDSLKIKLPISALRKDTVARYNNKRSSVKIKVRSGKVQIEATCLELEKLVLSKDKEITIYKQRIESYQEENVIVKTIKKNPFGTTSVLIILILLIIIYILFKQRLKNKS